MENATIEGESARTEKKPKRNTGDWRGFPNFLQVLSFLCIPLSVIGAGLTGSGYGEYSDILGWWSFFSILTLGLTLYGAATIIAALRGNLRE